MLSRWLYTGLVALVGVERLVELALSRRHARRAFEKGGIEVGRAHFRWMALLHAGLLAACVAEVWLLRRRFVLELAAPMLALALLAQALRYWVIATLGWRWNVRVIIVPGEPGVTSGPYRFMRHPNYLAVIVEGLALPLVHGAYLAAAAFTLLDALMLRVRIRVEERALAEHCDYDRCLGDKPRLGLTFGSRT